MKNDLINEIFISYYEARKHKRKTLNQLRFEVNMEDKLIELYHEIESRKYIPRRSMCFVVNYPIKREIFAADFKDRVVHHLIYRQIGPLFEAMFIDDSYSCRKDKGTLFGVDRFAKHIRRCSDNYTKECYILKLDIRGYFMSINRKILFGIIKNTIDKKWDKFCESRPYRYNMDKDLLLFLIKITVFNDATEGCFIRGKRSNWDDMPRNKSLFFSPEMCGLPIGNLTSQLFSNVYLNGFDHYMKRNLKLKHYGRYVDDMFIVHNDKKVLKNVVDCVKIYLREELGLILHPRKIYLQKIEKGGLFLGLFIKPYRKYCGRKLCASFYKTTHNIMTEKIIDPIQIRSSINSFLGLMKHSNSYNVRKTIINKCPKLFKYGRVDVNYSKFILGKKFEPNEKV